MRDKLLIFTFAVFLVVGFVKLFITPVPGVSREWVYRIPPKRGGIFDRYGRALSLDVYSYVGYLDLNFLKKTLERLDEISYLNLKSSLSRLLEKLNLKRDVNSMIDRGGFLKIAQSESRDEILSIVPRDLLPFLNVSMVTRRKSLDCCSIPQILGKVIDGKGLGGVEGFFDEFLKGKKEGKLILEVVRPFEVIPSPKGSIPPIDGKDLRLSIDLRLQKRVFSIVESAVKYWNAQSGNAIVMETKTGKIRAMVTTRSWNDNVMGYIEPGSSIKPVMYAIALETGSATPGFVHHCTGSIKPVEDLDITIGDIEPHGDVDFERALIVSCNTATVRIAKLLKDKIGEFGIYEWLRRFGFGEKTGIEIQGEIDGVLRDPKDWSAIDYAEISIGQGIGVTPIQLVSALNSIFNGGVYVKPTIVENSRMVSKRVLSKKTADYIKNIMVKVVEEGTGRNAWMKEIKIAGKTGTAQKAVGGKYTNSYHSIFIGSFPADDPIYTVLVHIDDPKGEYLGGEVAAPVFKEIVKVLSERDLPKKVRITPGVLPDFRGLSLKDVLYMAEILGIEVKYKGAGIVVDQDPAPGSMWVDEVKVRLSQPK